MTERKANRGNTTVWQVTSLLTTESLQVGVAPWSQDPDSTNLSTLHSSQRPGLGGTGRMGLQQSVPNPLPYHHVNQLGVNCAGVWKRRSLQWELSFSSFHTTVSYLNKAARFLFKTTWFQDGNNQAASSIVWKNTLVLKTLFSLKGESLAAPASGTDGCSESDCLTKLLAPTRPHILSCTQLPASITAPA